MCVNETGMKEQAVERASLASRMGRALASLGRKMVKSDNFVFTFLRSIATSQASSWVDLGSGIALVALGVSSWIATPVGAVLGGIVNCVLNYKYTFHAQNVSKRAVVVKFALVWFGSLVLNTVGTSLLAMVFDRWPLLEAAGFTNVGNYSAARLIVSLLVSVFWNILLQYRFVFRPTRFDKAAICLANLFIPSFRRSKAGD